MLKTRLVLFSAILLCMGSIVHAASSNPPTQFPLLWASDINGENFNVRAADLNGDGKGEVVADSIYQSMFGKDGLVRAFYSNGSVYWTYRAGLLESAYINPDGITAVGAGGQAVLLGRDGAAILRRNMRTSGPRIIVEQRVYAADLDGDGLTDLVGSINFGQKGGALEAWNSNGESFFDRGYKALELPYSFTAADLDGDKRKEIISGAVKYSVNSIGQNYDLHIDKPAYVEALTLDGDVKWSFSTEGGVSAVGADDINNDGSPEIVVGTPQKVYVLNWNGAELWRLSVDGTVYNVGFGDVNKDGMDEVFVGGDKLYVLDSKGGLVWSYASGTIYGLKVYDLDGDGLAEAILGTNSVRYVETDGSLVWKSDNFNKVRGVDAFDIDGDGFPEIVAGCSDSSVRVFGTADYLIKKKMEILYQRALEYSSDKRYGLCVGYASNATELSGRIGDSSMMVTAGSLKDKCVKYANATEYVNKSWAYYGRGDFGNATLYIENALVVYREFGDLKNVNEVSSLKDRIRLTPLAAEYMNYTRYYFAAGLYDNASYYAAQARTSYSYTGDGEGILNVDLILENISRMQAYEQVNLALNYSAMGFVNASSYLALANVTFQRLNDTTGLLALQNATLVVAARIKEIEAMNSIKSAANETVIRISSSMPVIVAFSIVGVIALLVSIAIVLSLYLNRGDSMPPQAKPLSGSSKGPPKPLFERKEGASLGGGKLGGV